jgi:hypothetical protein
MTLKELIEKYGEDEVLDAALRGGILHGTEDEDQDPYK